MFTITAAEKKIIRNIQGIQVKMHSYTWSPPTDVFETDDNLVVRVEVAGMRESDFSINVDNGYLVISGTRVDVQERRAYHQMEIRYGEFSTNVELTPDLDVTKADAEYRDGFLTIVLPRQKPVGIKVQG